MEKQDTDSIHETMAQPLFDAKQIAARLGRQRRSQAGLQMQVHAALAERLAERLKDVDRRFSNILDVSLDDGAMARLLGEQYPSATITRVAALLDPAVDDEQPWEGVSGEAELVVSNVRLPLVNDVPYFLLQAHRALKADGLLLASTLGVESFSELRQAFAAAGLSPNGHVVPMTDVREVGSLLQRLKFALPVVDRDVITLTFADFPALLKQLTRQGARNYSDLRVRGLLTPRQLAKVEEAYRRMFQRPDGRLPLTLEVIYLHGWKAADSQPQPLARGSGKVSLVRILGGDGTGGTPGSDEG